MSGKVKVWGNPVTVEWADPVAEPDPEVMAKVRESNTLLLKTAQICSVLQGNNIQFVFTGEGALCQEAGHSSH